MILLNKSCDKKGIHDQCLWFAKLKALVKISKTSRIKKGNNMNFEFAFVQFLEPIQTIDRIDRTLAVYASGGKELTMTLETIQFH